MAARLPHLEHRSGRILQHRHAPGIHDVERRRQHRCSQLLRALHGIVCALDGDVRVPVRRHPVLPLLGPQGAGRADLAAAQLKHRVHSVRAHLELVHIPAEEIAVEGDAGGLIGRGQLGPAEGSGWKRVDISHLCVSL